jgi:DNA-binding XRE family transcriptional regulator
MKKEVNYKDRNQNVAKARKDAWKKNLVEGKLDAKLNPTQLCLLRAKKKLSQQYVAKVMKLSLSTYGAIERSKRKITQIRARELSKILNTDLKNLFKTLDGGKLQAI